MASKKSLLCNFTYWYNHSAFCFRYVRVYPKLLECLQATRDFIGVPIEILSAYKPRSYNLQNIDERSPFELLRFQSGQAVEIRVTGYEDQELLGNLAVSVMRACSAQVRYEQHYLGVGMHRDRVALTMKVAEGNQLYSWLGMWNVDAKQSVFDRVNDVRMNMLTGKNCIHAALQVHVHLNAQCITGICTMLFVSGALSNCFVGFQEDLLSYRSSGRQLVRFPSSDTAFRTTKSSSGKVGHTSFSVHLSEYRRYFSTLCFFSARVAWTEVPSSAQTH